MPSSFGEWLIVILALVVGLLGGWLLRGRQAAASPTAAIVEGDPVAGVAEVSAPATATVDHERPAAVVDEVPPPAAVTEEPAPAEYDAPPAAATLAANATALPSTDAEPAQQAAAADTPAEVDATADTTPVEAEAAATDVPQPATVPAPRAAVEDTLTTDAPAVVSTPAEPDTAAVAAGQAADDFRRIQGIGPKMAAALQAAGIRTYQQLAELDEAALRETIKAAGLRAAPSVATWPQQAKLLAGARAEADRVLPVGAGEEA